MYKKNLEVLKVDKTESEIGYQLQWVRKGEFQEHNLIREEGGPRANTGGSQFFINVADNPDLDWWDKSALRGYFFCTSLFLVQLCPYTIFDRICGDCSTFTMI